MCGNLDVVTIVLGRGPFPPRVRPPPQETAIVTAELPLADLLLLIVVLVGAAIVTLLVTRSEERAAI